MSDVFFILGNLLQLIIAYTAGGCCTYWLLKREGRIMEKDDGSS